MKWDSFQTRAPGKWVLAGEHAVLRGAAALALPHPELALALRYDPDDSGVALQIQPPEVAGAIRDLLGTLPIAPDIEGRLDIQSSIPWGAGLGSSAALCVALTRWVSGAMDLPQAAFLDFATRLENRFHGKSSGMDIAVILAGEPVTFVRGQKASPLGVRRLPRFTFHDTGMRARTSDCVALVERFTREHPLQGQRLDQLMSQASRLAEEGLRLYDSGDQRAGLNRVGEAMTRSQECFESWGLIPPSVVALRRDLLSQGALAVKLTGAGGGGMLVALRDDSIRSGMI